MPLFVDRTFDGNDATFTCSSRWSASARSSARWPRRAATRSRSTTSSSAPSRFGVAMLLFASCPTLALRRSRSAVVMGFASMPS